MQPDADVEQAVTPEQRLVPAPPPHAAAHDHRAIDRAAFDPAGADHSVREVELAVSSLDGLDTMPVAGHVARFDAAHAALAQALASIDKV